MKQSSACAATLAALLAAGSVTAEPVSSAEIERAMAGLNASEPGCVVGVYEAGRLTARAVGIADLSTGRSLTPDSRFNIASVTKQFVGGAIALLIEEGRIAEQDDVRRYLPEMPDYGAPITIDHLLHHTSGLRDYLALADFAPGKAQMRNEDALALIIRQRGLNFAPGEDYAYSNSNYVLLAAVVERISGQGLQAFLTERFFTPLGMSHTSFSDDGNVKGYVRNTDGGFQEGDVLSRVIGPGNLITTVGDLGLWSDNLATGAVGGAGWVARMRRRTVTLRGSSPNYAYGLAVYDDWQGAQGVTLLTHNGSARVFNSSLYALPELRTAFIQLCNSSAAPMSIAANLARSRLPQPPAVAAASSAAQPTLGSVDTVQPLDPQPLEGWWLDPLTDRLLHLTTSDGKLSVDLGRSIAHLTQTGSGWELAGMMTLSLGSEGTLIQEVGSQRSVLRRLPPPATTFHLQDYVGEYGTDEIDGRAIVSMSGDGLQLATAESVVELTRAYQDGFTNPSAGIVNLRFERDAAGVVRGMSLSTPSGLRRFHLRRLVVR